MADWVLTCGAQLGQDSSSFCLRQQSYLDKLRHTVVSHQFNHEPCRFWPFFPAWHRESLICTRPVSSVGPQTEAAHSLRSRGDQIALPTHISHNLLWQDHPPGRAEMDTAIYNSHAEERGRMEGCGTEEETGSCGWGRSHTVVSTATMWLNWFHAISSILIKMKWASVRLKRLKQIEGGNHSW